MNGWVAIERGVALVVVLVLLAILTMLAIAATSTATAELAMAGNEQYRERAMDAASAGIEDAIAHLIVAPSASAILEASDYSVTTHFVGDETDLPGTSVGKLTAQHYVISSTGRSARGALDLQTQGVAVIVPAAGTAALTRVGGGLTGGSGP